MIRKLFFVLVCIPLMLSAQEFKLSPKAQISILTMGPGDQLYDSFGHSAFRVKDSIQNLDIVYNYGVYDFNTPNFYTKFARGKLLYNLAVTRFKPFYSYYKKQNRSIYEQTLNLTPEETQAVFDYLQHNAKPENKSYLYDFLYDNCATKIRDVLVSVLGNKLDYSDDFVDNNYTFRQLIQKNVNRNTWGSLGMDVAIGAVVDKKATAWEYQFLPEYVYKAAETATLLKGSKKFSLVKKQSTLFKGNDDRKAPTPFFISPKFIFIILGLIVFVVTIKNSTTRKRYRYLDGVIFFSTGLIGLFLLLLWLATDHSTTANNYNLLWAFPLNILFFKAISKKQPKKWLKKYVAFLLIILFLIPLHWLTGVQVFPLYLTPVFLALAFRYFYLLKIINDWEK